VAETLSVRARVRRVGHGEGFTLDVDVEVPPGITCVLGPSGAGKSTLLAAVAGLVRPAAGRIALGARVWFDASGAVDVPIEQRRAAYVFQGLALFPHLDAVGNVIYGMPRRLPKVEKRERAVKLLHRLGVGHLLSRRPRTFSGGEAQRVALARALAMEPHVILLDEPFSALDRALRLQLVTLVRELVDELEVPLLHVTHSHGEARALADRVVRIEHGKVVATGAPIEVLGKPGSRAYREEAEADADELEGTPMPELIRRR
jgi:molybdate transport system ATP-binding protein